MMRKIRRQKLTVVCNLYSKAYGLKSCLFTIMAICFSGLVFADKNQEEIKLASQAAPAHVTAGASFMKFDGEKFHEIKKGVNNFTCLVVRDPAGRFEPSCFNRQAMNSVFFTYETYMRLLYEGHGYEKVDKMLVAAFEARELPTAETGSLVYMMSENNLVYDRNAGRLRESVPHQMFFYPKLSDETFMLKGKDVFLWQGFPHLSALIVVVQKNEGRRY